MVSDQETYFRILSRKELWKSEGVEGERERKRKRVCKREEVCMTERVKRGRVCVKNRGKRESMCVCV